MFEYTNRSVRAGKKAAGERSGTYGEPLALINIFTTYREKERESTRDNRALTDIMQLIKQHPALK